MSVAKPASTRKFDKPKVSYTEYLKLSFLRKGSCNKEYKVEHLHQELSKLQKGVHLSVLM